MLLVACLGSPGQDQQVDPDDLFFDYKIWGEQGNDSVTVMLFFRNGGPTGPPVRIAEPGSVRLDGEQLQPDSNAMTGVFYTAHREVGQFTGKHSILYTDVNRRTYREDFVFRPMTFRSPLPDTIRRARLIVQLDGVDKMDVVRVLVSDTSYPGEGIDRMDTVWNSQVVLTRNALSYIHSGPVYLELSREKEWPIEQGHETRGLVTITYTIRKELTLID